MNQDIREVMPVCTGKDGNLQSMYPMKYAEDQGAVKFDFLGLKTLTIIDRALRSINRERRASDVAPILARDIPVNDPQTYDLLKSCCTTGVFQLESRGMRDLIRRLQPDCFDDLVAVLALFRPGPLQSGMVDDFIDRKHGKDSKPVQYFHPTLEPVLKGT